MYLLLCSRKARSLLFRSHLGSVKGIALAGLGVPLGFSWWRWWASSLASHITSHLSSAVSRMLRRACTSAQCGWWLERMEVVRSAILWRSSLYDGLEFFKFSKSEVENGVWAQWPSWFILPTGYCLKGNCPILDRDDSWPNWVPCWVFKGETMPSSYRGGTVTPLGPISRVSSSGDGNGGDLPAANPGSPGSGH